MNLNISCSSAEALLILLNLKGVGRVSAIEISKNFKTLEDVYYADPSEIKKSLPTYNPNVLNPDVWQGAYEESQKILEMAVQLDVNILSYRDQRYPFRLNQIKDFPPVLYLKGKLHSDCKYVACVGTRNPSRFGEKVTQGIVECLVKNEWGIVSGLAYGIDTIAHKEALKNGGYTIAVLANGLDSVYPAKNKVLAHEILESGGALISEQPFRVTAFPQHLVQRDRLQCGMSVATIPMETPVKGGTMHTIRFTLLQGRRLYVPEPTTAFLNEPATQGIIALLKNTGTELSKILSADSEYATLLTHYFADIPVACPITGRADYAKLIQELNSLYEKSTINREDNIIYEPQKSFSF